MHKLPAKQLAFYLLLFCNVIHCNFSEYICGCQSTELGIIKLLETMAKRSNYFQYYNSIKYSTENLISEKVHLT